MKRPRWYDPYRTVIKAFNCQGVKYVVVGMAGINYYAKGQTQGFSTMDYDIFLEPTLDNVGKALRSLISLGYTLGTAEGAFHLGALRQAVRARRTLVATTPEGVMVELLLQISGYPFSEIAKDAKTVSAQGVPVRVGQLHKLLQSKRLAGRPKDRLFLARYRPVMEEALKNVKAGRTVTLREYLRGRRSR